MILSFLVFPHPAQSQCIDFDEYLHLVGQVNTSETVYDIVIEDGFAFAGDNAGNLLVLDLSSPTNPALVATLSLGQSLNALTVVDNLLFATVESETDDQWIIQAVDITIPNSPQILGSAPISNRGWNLTCDAGVAYVACGLGGLNIIDVSDPSSPVTLNSVVGFEAMGVAMSGSHVLVSAKDQLLCLDITVPTAPVETSRIDTGYCLGVQVRGEYAYLIGQELRIVDISNIEEPVQVGQSNQGPIAASFKVELSGQFAYVPRIMSGLEVFDISDPTAPFLVGQSDSPRSIGFCLAVMDNFAYFPGDAQLLQVYDISSPTSLPTYGNILEEWLSPHVGIKDEVAFFGTYNDFQAYDISEPELPVVHGQINGNYGDFAFRGDYVYLCSSGSRLEVVDVSDPSQMAQVAELEISFHNVEIQGDYAYLLSSETLTVVDVSSASDPLVLGNYPRGGSFLVVEGDFAYIASYSNGLEIIDISDPAFPTKVGDLEFDGYVADLAVMDDHVYLVAYGSGEPFTRLLVLSVTQPHNPYVAQSLDFPGGWGGAVSVSQDRVYFASSFEDMACVYFLDVQFPSQPIFYGSMSVEGRCNDLAVADNCIVVPWIGLCGISSGFTTLPRPCEEQVAVFLNDFQVQPAGDLVNMHWQISGNLDNNSFRLVAQTGNQEREIPFYTPEVGMYVAEDTLLPDQWGQPLVYRLYLDDGLGQWILLAEKSISWDSPPPTTRLSPPYPNPFNPRVNLHFECRNNESVELSIFDLNGRKVITLVEGHLLSGNYYPVWEGLDSHGQAVAAGQYFVRMKTQDMVEVHKIILTK